MADGLIIEIESADVMAMLTKLGPKADALILDASQVTAERIQDEARARARRRTGRLVEAIEVRQGKRGFQVVVEPMRDERGPRAKQFPFWHEYGTKHMSKQPFMYNSARLEEGRHFARIVEALQQAIEEENG